MWSNDLFSSMSTTTWSTESNPIAPHLSMPSTAAMAPTQPLIVLADSHIKECPLTPCLIPAAWERPNHPAG